MKNVRLKRIGVLVALSIAGIGSSLAAAHFSNVIVFGDSLSDIGNMPESHYVMSPATGFEAENMYVPISNPVDTTSSPTYTPPMSTEVLSYPELVTDYQNYQPKLALSEQNAQAMKRTMHSYNWPLFFVNQAYQHRLIDTPTITPWYLTQKSNPNAEERGQVSVDYAFAGAVSENMCYDFTYNNGNPNCAAKDIYNGQETYRDGKTQVTTVEVPGFQKQVGLFLNDQKSGRLVTDGNTLYVVMTGNNDLNKALITLSQASKDPQAAMQALKNVYAGGVIKGIQSGIQNVIQSGAKHVVVVGMYDPGKTPYLATDISQLMPKLTPLMKGAIQMLASSTALDFDVQLQMMVANLKNKNPSVDIQYFDIFNRLNQLHDQMAFGQKATKFQACIDQLSQNNLSSFITGQPLSCVNQATNTSEQQDYMFWNMTHMTAKTNEYLADQLYKALQK